MPHVTFIRIVAPIAVLMASVCFSGHALAGDDVQTLNEAIGLFGVGDYLAAQELLVDIDRSKLSKNDQARRDDYVRRVQVALRMEGKALRDLEDAESAMAENDNEQARLLLDRVLANEYAPEPARKKAAADRRRLLAADDSAPAEGSAEVSSDPAIAAQVIVEEKSGPTTAQVRDAKDLTVQADGLVTRGQYDEADGLYHQAIELVPGYPDAVDGLSRVRAHRENAGARGESLIDRLRRENEINWQRHESQFREVTRQIHVMVGEARFDEANQSVLRARQIVESGKQFADPSTKYDQLKAEMSALAEHVERSQRQYEEDQVAIIREQIRTQRQIKRREREEDRKRQIDALMAQARQHRKDREYQQAITVLKQVTVIDPRMMIARDMLDMLEDDYQYYHERQIHDDYRAQTRRALNAVEETKIPWADQLRYPDNWLNIIDRPERRRSGETREDSLLWGALDQPVRPDFKMTPFNRVMERLATTHNININVNWNDLQASGVEIDTPISLSLPNEITLKKTLELVLEDVSALGTRIGFDVNDGVMTVATRKLLDAKTYPAVYNVVDLLMEIPNFNDAPITGLHQMRPKATHSSPYSVQPWIVGDDDDDEPDYDPEVAARVFKIIDIIQKNVQPNSWVDFGGTIATIEEINGQLVVTQNSAGHAQISGLLDKLREQRAIQIGIEARFITVSSHYLEELGIDLDIVLNPGNAGFDFISGGGNSILTDPVLGSRLLLPRTFTQLGFTPLVPTLGTASALGNAGVVAAGGSIAQPFLAPVLVPQPAGGIIGGSTATPVPILSNILRFTDPAGLSSDVPGTFAGNDAGPALRIFGSFLDNIQVDFLVRATQADSRTNVLTAPRLVLVNGQRSWVAVTLQTNFVSTLTPVVATGAAAIAPITGTVNAGAVLDVQATVSADKRYVTINLRPGVVRLNAISTFQFSGGVTGQGFIQLPETSSQLIKTTVSVPDGGTLLIGGQKLGNESEVEAGVPILSKIPILKRMYSSRSMVKDEQTLLILIKPRIFIQSEQEELAFPRFNRG
ncbi:MAG: hypothetical protein IID36_00750 [Planctomycetes bacterium]|nr:hypothetical protein [Planctomycetota bacterium]